MRSRRRLIGSAPILAALIVALALALAGAATAFAAGPIAPGGVGAPQLLTPAAGSSSVAPPLLSWEPVTEGVEYYLEVWSTAMPSGGTAQSGARTTQSSYVPAGLGPGLWSWRVKALGVGNTFGPLSATRTFTILPMLTAAPSLMSPATGATFAYPVSPAVLRWSSVSGATGYDVQLATNAAFTAGVETHRTSLPAMAAPTARLNATTYWRVRAIRAVSSNPEHLRELGPWSSGRTYSMAWATAPTPVSPENGATVASLLAEWTPIAGAASYEVAWTTAADPGFAAATVRPVNLPNAYLDVVNGTTVLWRVRASVDGSTPSGFTPWSTIRSAVIDPAGATPTTPAPPSLPQVVLTGPADGAVLASNIDAPFQWTPIAGPTGYQIQSARLDVDFDIVSPASSGPGALLLDSVGNAVAGQTYKWRVRAVGAEGSGGPWSEVRKLSIAANAGSTLVSPASGASVPGATALVSWSSSPTSGLHDVEFSRTPDFADSRYYASILGTRLAANLRKGLWYWRVWDHGEPAISVSATRSFTVVDTDPPVGRMVLNGGSPFLAEGAELLNIYTEQEDLVGDLASIDLSWNGRDWTTYPVAGDTWSIYLPVTSAEAGGATPGRRDVHVRWRDADGNATEPIVASIWYGVEPPTTPPVAAMTALASIQQRPSFAVTWSATAAMSPVANHDVRVRRAAWNGGFGAMTMWRSATTATTATFSGIKGSTYCFSSRTRDVAGLTSGWTAETCTAVPLDDRSLSRSRSWTAITHPSDYAGTALRTSTSGATLTRTGVVARRISLLVTTCPTCGSVRAYWQGVLVRTINLSSPTVVHRKVVSVVAFSSGRVGTFSIRVSSTGKPIFIDAVSISRL